jgi:hypothetical protein
LTIGKTHPTYFFNEGFRAHPATCAEATTISALLYHPSLTRFSLFGGS